MTTPALFTNSLFGFTVRGLQILFAFLTWTLEAAALDKFSTYGGYAWLLVVGIIAMIYVVVVLSLSFFSPGSLIPGAIFVIEIFCAVGFFTAFIASAAWTGDVNCNAKLTSGWVVFRAFDAGGCNAAKAGIAFGAFSWALFTFTSVVVGFYVVRTLNTANLWHPARTSGTSFSRSVFALKTGSSKSSGTVLDDEETTVGEVPAVEKGEGGDTNVESEPPKTVN